MKKILTSVLIFFATLGYFQLASAQDFFSFGERYFREKYLGADIVKYNDFGYNAQGVLGAYIGMIGPLPVALEGRASFSVADEDEVELNFHIGGYLRAEYRSGQLRPYVLLGISYAEYAIEYYGFLNGYSLNLEYIGQLVDEVDGFSIGLRKNF